ncbi:MAG TPA: hypothetical protein VG267_09245 [Terracidiphilus sp.]|jgi:hypothetical protein|nr:hypothetical protein [Terracidiphilus sp.]
MKSDVWTETTATVYSCGWEDEPFRFSRVTLSSGRYLIVFSYEVDGSHYSGEFRSDSEWKEGSTFPIKYNPADANENDRADESAGPLVSVLIFVLGVAVAAIIIWLRERK